MTPTEFLIHNERTKLLANALDRASTASMAVGVLSPVVTSNHDFGFGQGSPSLPTLAVSSILWLAMAIWLHILALRAGETEMNGYIFFAYIALPLIVGAIGTLAVYLHVRADEGRSEDQP